MSTFSAKTAGLSRMDYDFREWLGGDGPVGIIPEPSDKMIEEFFDTVREIQRESGVGDDTDVDELSDEELAELTDELDLVEQQQKMTKAVAGLCSQSPKEEDINRLPFRVRQVFFKWVMKQINDPELSASASKPSRGRRTGG